VFGTGQSRVIHATAIIDQSARLAHDVSVGAYSIIGAEVEIGSGTRVGPHVVINGPTSIGKDNQIFQFASIGEVPQDKKFAGERTTLEIGERNITHRIKNLPGSGLRSKLVREISFENSLPLIVVPPMV